MYSIQKVAVWSKIHFDYAQVNTSNLLCTHIYLLVSAFMSAKPPLPIPLPSLSLHTLSGTWVIERILLSTTATPDVYRRMFCLLLAALVLSHFARTSSFYDNPEQDPIPPTGPDNAEELHKKWDFEVLFCYCISLP